MIAITIIMRMFVCTITIIAIALYALIWGAVAIFRRLAVVVIILLFIGCEKEDIRPSMPKEYTVRLFANGQQNFIRYNIVDFYDKKPIAHFDTTFTAPSGWTLRFAVTAEQWPMNAGVVIDGVVVANCANEREFFYEHKF
jgi:hypothetical protein